MLSLELSGHTFWAGEKYTILEQGWAVYLAGENQTPEWFDKFAETKPKEDGFNDLQSGNGMLVTSHPILVALAIRSWWHRNGETITTAPRVEIPLLDEAIEEVKKRRILNPFNEKWAGIVPGIHHKERHNQAGDDNSE